jgi:hypothetical protein
MTLNKYKKSCIAWFKLAEFVDRKEKEKALMLYNLLSKSLNNQSFSLTLLGTIYNYFEEPHESKKYLDKALELEQELSLEIIIAIKEYLIFNKLNQNPEFIKRLVQDYKIYYNNKTMIKTKIQELSKFCDKDNLIFKSPRVSM